MGSVFIDNETFDICTAAVMRLFIFNLGSKMW